MRTNGIALVKARAGVQKLESFAYAECTAARRLETLKLLVEAQGCTGAACNLVLLPEQYSLLQVERPAVNSGELADAVRWRIKDFIDFPLDDAVVDVFEFPSDATRNRGALVNVVVGRKPLIQDLIALIQDAGLSLHSIDIAELAVRNIANTIEDDQKGVVTLVLRQGHGLMTLTRNGTLYLSRRLDVDVDGLVDPDRAETIGQQLALEVQRSLDYYESQLGQPPARRLLVATTDQADQLLHLLSRNLAVPVSSLDGTHLQNDDLADTDNFLQCLIAAGAALRKEAA